ncbi:MAG: DUF1579 family protein [Planctomycetes bacterium]|nr:DUF1579 family protein [Planctomycetota bacterium]
MKQINSARAAFVLALSFAVFAIAFLQERSTAVASAPNAQTDEAPKLSPEQAHELLGRLIGAWNVAGEAVSPAGQVEKRLQGRAVWQWALSGVFLFGDTVLNNGAAAIQEVDTIGFNSGGQFFQRNLLTDQDPSMIWQKGSFNPGFSQLTLQTVSAIPTQTDASRTITTLIDFSQTDQIGWTMLYTQSGATVGTVRLVLTRAPAEQLVGGGATGGSPAMVPVGAQPSPADAAAMQAQLNQMVANKQQMQKQIEAYKAQVTAAQASFRQLNQQ